MVQRTPLSKRVIPRLRFQGTAYQELLRPWLERRYGDMHSEYLVEGPTGTGKTILIGALCKSAMIDFPGCNVLVMRHIKADLEDSFMQTWQDEVLDPDNEPWDRWMLDRGTGRIPAFQSRKYYEYPNGSKLWLRGMNQWARFKSKRFDIIWPLEMTEFTEEEIEVLHTRLRAQKDRYFPHRMLIGDVNPEYPEHWANQRAIAGVSYRIKTTLKDNPGYYDLRRGEFTEDGQDYLDRQRFAIRDEVRRRKYLDGIWTAPEGQILPFDPARQVFDGSVKAIPGQGYKLEVRRPGGGAHPVLGHEVLLRGFGASFDWGSRHAGTLQVWALDDDGRQYLIEEVYHSRKPHSWWADWALKFYEKYELQFIVCDGAGNGAHDVFNERLEAAAKERGLDGGKARIARLCRKRQGTRERTNIEILQDLFHDQPDGKPGVYFRRESLAHQPDAALKDKPKKLIEEVPRFVYAENRAMRNARGRQVDKAESHSVDDGLDACVYFRVHVIGGRGLQKQTPRKAKSTNPWEIMNEHYWRTAS